MSKVQVLVASMNQIDHSLLTKMNIKSDAIIGNQCDHNSIEHFNWNDYRITYLNFAERGVGLNRNNSLMRADADICLFADDDLIYKDNYVQIITSAFDRHPDASVLAFNLEDESKEQYRKLITKEKRVTYFNCLRYGTARIAIRLSRVRFNGILFNQCFGGGTVYKHGEDNLFVVSCLSKGLKMYSIPETIATLTDERDSSWNNGYDNNYIEDQGILFRCMTRKYWRFLCFQDALRRHKSYGKPFLETYKLMISKVKETCN